MRPVSRRQFIGLAGGSLAAASLLSACGDDSSAQASTTAAFGAGDVGILNYGLTLEYTLAAFYKDLVKGDLFGGEKQITLEKFGSQEEDHAAALVKQIEKLGGKPIAEPQTDFSPGSETDALELASTLENAVAAAYLGQLPNLKSETARSKLLEIHSVEGRHAAAVAYLLEEDATPDGPFAEPASVESVMDTVGPYMTLPSSVSN
jgi:rubrerythrin